MKLYSDLLIGICIFKKISRYSNAGTIWKFKQHYLLTRHTLTTKKKKKKVENSTQILFKSPLFHPQFILIFKKDIHVQSMQLILHNNLKAVVNQIYFPFKVTITKAYHYHSKLTIFRFILFQSSCLIIIIASRHI